MDHFRWIDPFEEIENIKDDARRWVEDEMDLREGQVRYALAEIGRIRSATDQALHAAIQKYVPQVGMDIRATSLIMDGEIVRLLQKRI